MTISLLSKIGITTEFGIFNASVDRSDCGSIILSIRTQAAVFRSIASHISERTITIIGGLLFILFAIIALVTGK